MGNMRAVVEKIRSSKERYNSRIEQPLATSKLEDFKEKFLKTYDFEVPKGFSQLLTISDGLEFNGYIIYGATDVVIDGVARGFFKLNQLWIDAAADEEMYVDFIFFAQSGMDQFVLRKSDRSYHAIDRVSGDIVESFTTAEEMIEYVLNLMLDT